MIDDCCHELQKKIDSETGQTSRLLKPVHISDSKGRYLQESVVPTKNPKRIKFSSAGKVVPQQRYLWLKSITKKIKGDCAEGH